MQRQGTNKEEIVFEIVLGNIHTKSYKGTEDKRHK